jgi:hypothetical protein
MLRFVLESAGQQDGQPAGPDSGDTYGEDDFIAAAQTALRVLAARPGYLRGSAARATDDPRQWIVITEWLDVGSYRRALGAYDVKVNATPLLARAIDDVSAFEELIQAAPGSEAIVQSSDRASDR